MARKQCPGTGQPAVARPGSVYPYCPHCGEEMAAQGRKAQQRYANAWRQVPRHFRSKEEQ
jgi:uncharacterized Zn finger protein (UPF0148 family)